MYGWARTHARTHVHTHTRTQAVADETFADERSKEMFENDTREKLIKELLKQEIRNDFFYTNAHMNAYMRMRMYEHHTHIKYVYQERLVGVALDDLLDSPTASVVQWNYIVSILGH